MPRINLSQYQFRLRDPYQSGQVMTELEANALNYHRADLIRKTIVAQFNRIENEAEDGVLTIEQLDEFEEWLRQFDERYELTNREVPKLPAFDHQLRNIAIIEISRLGPPHLMLDFEDRLEEAMRDPANRQKARRTMVAHLRSIIEGGEDEDG